MPCGGRRRETLADGSHSIMMNKEAISNGNMKVNTQSASSHLFFLNMPVLRVSLNHIS